MAEDRPIFESLGEGTLMFGSAEQCEPIVTIRRDGTIEVSPKYTVDEAAKAFWDAVMKIAGTWRRIA